MNLACLTYGAKEQATVPGGGLHPITLRVLDYVHAINWTKPSALFVEVDRIIITELLESSLEAISKIYNNPTLDWLGSNSSLGRFS
ncbi:Exocyst complex component EXO70B1 [Spatholobus suberectus]|nr:Exocyst complex component EXO70B1 [Spatholobus suberectus]